MSPPTAGTSALPHRYGSHPAQVADLHLPSGGALRGVVVTIHGGFWAAEYDRTLEDALVRDLVSGGYAVWNVDYRGVGGGGGWPATFDDLATALDLLPGVCEERGLPSDRTALVGHSAGGHLALWAAARHRLPAAAPGAGPVLRPAAVVSQAGIPDLLAAHRADLGEGAVAGLLGVDPSADLRADPQQRYLATSPAELLPTAVPTLLVTGAHDDRVPAAYSREHAARATAAGDDVRLEVVAGEGHFEHLDPGSRVWKVTRTWLDGRFGPPG